ncbi:hypothetical protein Q3G72_009955 [Acer saccharum]|nr:hypothetical protein Q3G72_009955 [Acer saccharum]
MKSVISLCMTSEHAFKEILTSLPKPGSGEFGKFYSLPALNDPRIDRLPYSIRILLESAIRNCDNFQVTKEDVEKIIDWENTSPKLVEIPFQPARVLLQDFTGVPAVVDLACMRDAMKNLGSDPQKINPLVPVDLVVDHSVQVDVARSENAVQLNMELEFQRNKERFAFLKWSSSGFHNMLVVLPGSGIVHQVNLEYLGRVVFNTDGLYPDSVVGTDSHTTMIDGLGVAGWGVRGIEAKAAMLGQEMAELEARREQVKLNVACDRPQEASDAKTGVRTEETGAGKSEPMPESSYRIWHNVQAKDMATVNMMLVAPY